MVSPRLRCVNSIGCGNLFVGIEKQKATTSGIVMERDFKAFVADLEDELARQGYRPTIDYQDVGGAAIEVTHPRWDGTYELTLEVVRQSLRLSLEGPGIDTTYTHPSRRVKGVSWIGDWLADTYAANR